MSSSLVVLTPMEPYSIAEKEEVIAVSDADQTKDALDEFNHPRLRRVLILQELMKRNNGNDTKLEMDFQVFETNQAMSTEDWTRFYSSVHSPGLLDFLATAWSRWTHFQPQPDQVLISGNAPLLRETNVVHRPSKSPLGAMGYYCNDEVTPVFCDLFDELQMDATLIQAAVHRALQQPPPTCIYTMVTHPGHHAAHDSFGGYCYVNHVAAMAKLVQQQKGDTATRVAILDVDYHVGNGTASLFHTDPSVMVVSLHCDPDYEYPFHSGYADDTGSGAGVGTTLHVPLPPGTDWTTYEPALERGVKAIAEFDPVLLIVSMGLDTHDLDPVCVRRAGFHLQGDDYQCMGETLAKHAPKGIPVIILQEGGYRMEKVAQAAANVITSFCAHR